MDIKELQQKLVEHNELTNAGGRWIDEQGDITYTDENGFIHFKPGWEEKAPAEAKMCLGDYNNMRKAYLKKKAIREQMGMPMRIKHSEEEYEQLTDDEIFAMAESDDE